jgi:hypothetical protein
VTVYDDHEFDVSPLAVYNEVLNSETLVEMVDQVIPISNNALENICTKQLKYSHVGYSDLNHLGA